MKGRLTKLTRQQAAVIGVATGTLCGPMSDLQELAEELLSRPIYTHEFGDSELWVELKEKARPTLLKICAE